MVPGTEKADLTLKKVVIWHTGEKVMREWVRGAAGLNNQCKFEAAGFFALPRFWFK